MSIENIRILTLNPNFMAIALQNFIDGYGKPIDIKLLFYCLPILLYKDSRNKLATANSRSRIETLFSNKFNLENNESIVLNGKVSIVGFVERFEELKPTTKHAIIILHSNNKINLGQKVELLDKNSYKNYNGKVNLFFRAAYYLGVVFSKTSFDYLNLFLGVNQ